MKQSLDELVSFEKRLMKDVFRVWSVTNILEERVASSGWIVTQQVLLVADCWRTFAKTAETWRYTHSDRGHRTPPNESGSGRKQDKRVHERLGSYDSASVCGKGVIGVCPLKVSSEFADLRSDWL